MVKLKKIDGGGYLKIIKREVKEEMRKIGYQERKIEEIEDYEVGNGNINKEKGVNKQQMKQKGFKEEKIEEMNEDIKRELDIKLELKKWKLGEDF